MLKTQIAPNCIQSLLDSASNAAAKGLAQYLTPPEWSRALAQALPRFRPVLVDLHCGAGNLLRGAARPSTDSLLGCDIDGSAIATTPSLHHSITPRLVAADVAKLYPLLKQVHFAADCFVLNPPWDLHQYRAPLAALAQSHLSSVREAFQAHDGRTSRDTIDSTVAALCLALDLCTVAGEGFLIANESTLQRLILGPDAPHRALAPHIWAHLVIEGNICAPSTPSTPSTFQTGVVYFAADHDQGISNALEDNYQPPLINSLSQCESVCATLHKNRLDLRTGCEIKSYGYTDTTTHLWLAVAEEWRRITSSASHPSYNLWLSDGIICTNLSLFDNASGRVDKQQAEALHSLGGKRPIQLVMQREQRRALERAAFGTTWRVDCALQTAVKEAVVQYQKVRAPLYPLSPIQRLGYLDEQDEIVCRKDLFSTTPPLHHSNTPSFRSDRRYALRSTTVAVKRDGEKLNERGQHDHVQWDGQELAFFITDDSGVERVFMEARLRSKDIRISILKPGEKPGQQDEDNIELCPIDFTLHDLVEHFEIPEVPDVARVNPQGYQHNLNLLKEIELVCQ
jgi:predicted RNA methylase